MADSHVGCLTVKGSALIGLDAANSVQKTLRKPAEQIKALMSGGAPAARKYFKEIKATETVLEQAKLMAEELQLS